MKRISLTAMTLALCLTSPAAANDWQIENGYLVTKQGSAVGRIGYTEFSPDVYGGASTTQGGLIFNSGSWRVEMIGKDGSCKKNVGKKQTNHMIELGKAVKKIVDAKGNSVFRIQPGSGKDRGWRTVKIHHYQPDRAAFYLPQGGQHRQMKVRLLRNGTVRLGRLPK